MAETRPLPIPDWMVIDSVRYALGRATYQVSTTTEWLQEHWGELDIHTRAVVVRDVSHAFETDRVGMDMDRTCWARVLERAGVPIPERPRYRYPVLSAEEAEAEAERRAR